MWGNGVLSEPIVNILKPQLDIHVFSLMAPNYFRSTANQNTGMAKKRNDMKVAE